MAELALDQIAKLLAAKQVQVRANQKISRLLIDSRQFVSADACLFFALRGQNHDGHHHLFELMEKGVVNFVVEEVPRDLQAKANFIQVENTRAALQQLGRAVRKNSKAKVLAITGSNGKTVVKEWLSQLVQYDLKQVRSPKSFNSQVGVPLSLWRMDEDHELAIIEAGISKPGEMGKLAEIIQPDWGIFTNIGSAHSENFALLEQKIDEKLLLFKEVQLLIYEKNNSFLAQKIEAFAAENGIELFSWGLGQAHADVNLTMEEGEVRARWNNQTIKLDFPFADEGAVQNFGHSLSAALALGVAAEKIAKRAPKLQPVEMRLEMKRGIQGNLIINDAYNSDLESIRIALHFLEHHGKNRDKVLILSDVYQSGLPPKELYQKISKLINSSNLLKVIAIGERIGKYNQHFNCPTQYYPNTEAFLRDWPRHHFSHSAILLKGARKFHFEKISQRLEQKNHETVLHVNLHALIHNLNYYRAQLRPHTKIMAMVKAFGYGSGAFEVANALQFHGVNYLGVAYADEGVELRKAGISLPILVLNPELSAMPDMVKYTLEPEIYSFKRLREFAEHVTGCGEKDFPIHLKLETGMNRLGFTEEELPQLIAELQSIQVLKVESVFSHLAASDEALHDDFTRKQIAQFEQMSGQLEAALPYTFWRHLANSAAISRFPEAHFNLVRLGISLYGAASNEEEQKHLRVVSELKATVSQVKDLKPGETVSYGRSFTAHEAMQIAIISLGYADGFRRSLSNGRGEVFIRGKRYPTVGRVCMDMCMVNVTGSEVQEGDAVEIFGENISVNELAQNMDTIPYEVFTGISQRVKRVYFME